MKKVFYSLVALCAVFAISCQKEVSQDYSNITDDGAIPTVIIGEINASDASTDNEVFTKTQYAGNTTFGWTNGDQIRMPVVKWSGANATGSITACDHYTFTTSDASGSTTATFIQNGSSSVELDTYDPNPSGNAATWTSLGYLIYPTSISNKQYSGTKPVVTLPASIVWSETAPLDGGVVPMIGRKDGDKYKFSTAVGFIKVTLSKTASGAASLKLVSTDKPIAGSFVISDVDAKVSQIANTDATSGTYELTLTNLSYSAGSSYEFYFPVPVGNYPANTLSVIALDSNNVPLLEKTIAKALTIERNQVLAVPELPYHRVYLKGSMSNPLLYTINPYASDGGTIRMIVSREKLTKDNYVKADWPGGNRFGANQNGWALTSHADFLQNQTGTGLFYLQYIVCSNGTQPDALTDDQVKVYGSVPFYFAPAANKISVGSSWLDVPYVSTQEGAVANLVDGGVEYGNYWHSPYSSENPARNATYGQIISVDLNEGNLTTKGDFYFSFCTRNGALQNHAKKVNVYVSNVRWDDAGFDSAKVLVGSIENAVEGIYPYNGEWIKTPVECTREDNTDYRYITVSILSNDQGYDLRSAGCTHMAEIEFYTK